MSVLIITLVTTTSVKATSYTADNSVVISSQYHDYFNNYFNGSKSYLYFPYSCNYDNYTRTCYYGIDSDYNYVKIYYSGSGSYSYSTIIEMGTDENFSVTGSNVIRKGVSPIYIIIWGLAFVVLIRIVLILLGGVF